MNQQINTHTAAYDHLCVNVQCVMQCQFEKY